jgi:hypothetical protein
VKAAETGTGIFEMEPGLSSAECRQFMPIADWVTGQLGRRDTPAANVYPLGRDRFA